MTSTNYIEDGGRPTVGGNQEYARDYYPFGSVLNQSDGDVSTWGYGYQVADQAVGMREFAEQEEELGGLNSFQLRLYDPVIGRWLSTDPMREFASPYLGMGNNPVSLTDPTGGTTNDWFEDPDTKELVWLDIEGDFIDNVGDLWKSVSSSRDLILANHARDKNHKEAVNAARIEVYKASIDKFNPIATINGNTVPADVPSRGFGTLAEGLYAADYAPRTKYPKEQAVFIWRLDRKSISLPSVTNKATVGQVFLHKGNWDAKTLISREGKGPQYSEACQTTGCGPEAEGKHKIFMDAIGKHFKGNYYLRRDPRLPTIRYD